MTDVFISYSHQDRDVARRYADALQAAGLAVWWDDHLRSGEAFDEKIEAARSGHPVGLYGARKTRTPTLRAQVPDIRRILDQAQPSAATRRRLRSAPPASPKPMIIIAQVAGSGTTPPTPTVKPCQFSLVSVKLSEVNVPLNCSTP